MILVCFVGYCAANRSRGRQRRGPGAPRSGVVSRLRWAGTRGRRCRPGGAWCAGPGISPGLLLPPPKRSSSPSGIPATIRQESVAAGADTRPARHDRATARRGRRVGPPGTQAAGSWASASRTPAAFSHPCCTPWRRGGWARPGGWHWPPGYW